MKEQSPEERIRFLEHGVQWRSELIVQWKAHQDNLWRIVEGQEEMIKALTRQRDAARVELACMLAAEKMILGKQQYTPERVLEDRGWTVDWAKLDKPTQQGEPNAQ